MNSNREDYLKVLYSEGGIDKFVSNKLLAEHLNVAPGSVSEMLTKLSKAGLTEFVAYKGSKLTEYGAEVCMKIIRRHRLWEVFLMNKLNYTWREAHEDAHLLEHISSERMIERLDEFLGYPEC